MDTYKMNIYELAGFAAIKSQDIFQSFGLWAILLKFFSPLKISGKDLKPVWMLHRYVV